MTTTQLKQKTPRDLRKFAGKWVAFLGSRILASADTENLVGSDPTKWPSPKMAIKELKHHEK